MNNSFVEDGSRRRKCPKRRSGHRNGPGTRGRSWQPEALPTAALDADTARRHRTMTAAGRTIPGPTLGGLQPIPGCTCPLWEPRHQALCTALPQPRPLLRRNGQAGTVRGGRAGRSEAQPPAPLQDPRRLGPPLPHRLRARPHTPAGKAEALPSPSPRRDGPRPAPHGRQGWGRPESKRFPRAAASPCRGQRSPLLPQPPPSPSHLGSACRRSGSSAPCSRPGRTGQCRPGLGWAAAAVRPAPRAGGARAARRAPLGVAMAAGAARGARLDRARPRCPGPGCRRGRAARPRAPNVLPAAPCCPGNALGDGPSLPKPFPCNLTGS